MQPGSMQTTLRDYATFLSALMSGKIPDRRTTGEMFDSQIRIHSAHQFPSLAVETTTANDGIRLRYGIGWGPIPLLTAKPSLRRVMTKDGDILLSAFARMATA